VAFTETTERRVPFTTDDGLALNLINITSAAGAQRGPVLLVHGAGVRADLFRPPTERTVVDVLVDEGYDVWLENWRASPEVEPSNWNLDQAARFDHPAAVQTVVNETGADTIKAIIHCQGSCSFVMSSIAGLVPEVDTIISNAVSLHPIVPAFSKLKLRTTLPIVARFIDSVDPAWGDHPPRGIPQLINGIVKLSHHECDVTECKLVSFTYGAGYPALWLHEHLNDEVHDRFIAEVFGRVPMSFFRHMGRCVKAGHLVALEPTGGLPAHYTAGPPQTDARFSFFTGWRNRCFLPESQIKSHEWFDRWRPGYHTLTVLPRYSHLDVFLGSNAHRDVFPLMLNELARTGG
jgi:hypothetical protein